MKGMLFSTHFILHPSAFTLSQRRRAGYDLDDLARDARLADAIHVERQGLDQLARVLRRRVHRRHARALLRGDGLQERAVDLRLDEARQQAAEDLRGRLLVDVLYEGLRLTRLRRLHLGARDREDLLDDDALRDDRAELVEDEEDLVQPLVFGEAAQDVARDLQRLGVLDPPLAGQPDVLAGELPAAAEEVAPFAAHGQNLDLLAGVLAHQLRRRDHLHGLRDLLRVLDRLDPPADV